MVPMSYVSEFQYCVTTTLALVAVVNGQRACLLLQQLQFDSRSCLCFISTSMGHEH